MKFHFPSVVPLAVLGVGGLLLYVLAKKHEFPFNKNSVFMQLKDDLSNVVPQRDGSASYSPGRNSPTMMDGGNGSSADNSGFGMGPAPTPSPGYANQNVFGGGVPQPNTQNAPGGQDMAAYQNYIQGLQLAFPQNQYAGPQGTQIGGDVGLFNPQTGLPAQNTPPTGVFPAQGLIPPMGQQQYPYYKAPPIPIRGSAIPPSAGRYPYPPPARFPPVDLDDVWSTPPPSSNSGGGLLGGIGNLIGDIFGNVNNTVGNITGGLFGNGGSGSNGGLFGGNNGGGLNINLGGLGGLGGFNSSGLGNYNYGQNINRNNNVSVNGMNLSGLGGSINSQVQNMLNDVFAQVGINR